MVKRGEYGSNMIKVIIQFWTNNIETTDKKVAWESGVAYLNGNKYRGIKPKMERFWAFEDMPKAVIKVFKEGQIKLKPLTEKYIDYAQLENKVASSKTK